MLRIFTALLLMFQFSINAQSLADGKAAIKEMCGCYEVVFQYAETFAGSDDYQRHDDYSAKGLEWIFADEEMEDMLMLQHLLIVNDSTVIKHWRQDWHYENTELLTYVKNLEWRHTLLDDSQVSRTWTQKVYEVDDSPRYQGYATWVNVDGKRYWESQVIAPLPRREYTKRHDYNVMLRTNKHMITETGHVHELDNAKLIRTADADSVVVWEKGMNRYTRVANERCALAREYWKNERAFWVDVRQVWDNELRGKEYVNVKWEVDGDRLWQRIFALQNELTKEENYILGSGKDKIEGVISEYLSNEVTPWAVQGTVEENSY